MNLYCFLFVIFKLLTLPQNLFVCGGGGALEERASSSIGSVTTQYHPPHQYHQNYHPSYAQHHQPSQQQHHHQQQQQQQQHHHREQQHQKQQHQQQQQHSQNYPSSPPSSSVGKNAAGSIGIGIGVSGGIGGNSGSSSVYTSLSSNAVTAGSGQLDHHKNSYNLLSEAMSQAVSHEFSSLGSGSADGACHADDLDCFNVQDRLGMEAIRSLHRQLDDDDNGNIDLSESDDFLREELKYDSGYEKRQKAFHYNDDMHISVKELWEAWLRSEVHNWTIEQTTDWLAQSVQLPQYVDLFKQHKVTGAALPRLAVNNMHYVSNVLGIKDPIHKQKIALKAMDVVLFGPPRETGTRWKDYILVTLLLSAIIGCWYAYQQNKNAKRHLKRMAQDMEGLQKAEQALQEMQKELELARMEQENVATEKLDLERRLKEAPTLSSSNSDLELQQLKAEIEMLRSELSRAEIELVDHCWSPPPQLQTWLQYTYEIESRHHLRKRLSAEKQLQSAREACEKLRRKRSSLVGAFVSTHGKSIDDVDRSIVEARNSLSEVTNELQERLHRWKQIEIMTGFTIVNNNGLTYLENILYNRNGTANSITGKSSRGRITNSTDDLDDDSVQGRNIGSSGGAQDDSSVSEDGDNQSVQFYLGNNPSNSNINSLGSAPSIGNLNQIASNNSIGIGHYGGGCTNTNSNNSNNNSNMQYHDRHHYIHHQQQQHQQQQHQQHQQQQQQQQQQSQNHNSITNSSNSGNNSINSRTNLINHNSHPAFNSHESISEDKRSPSVSSERSAPIPPRTKKSIQHQSSTSSSNSISTPSGIPPPPPPSMPIGRTPLPPPRKQTSQQSEFIRPKSTDAFPMDKHYQNYTSSKTPSNAAIGRSYFDGSNISQTSSPTGNFNFNIKTPSQSVSTTGGFSASTAVTTPTTADASLKCNSENIRSPYVSTGSAASFISKFNNGTKFSPATTTPDSAKSNPSTIWFTDFNNATTNDKCFINNFVTQSSTASIADSNGSTHRFISGSNGSSERHSTVTTANATAAAATTTTATANLSNTISASGTNTKEWSTSSQHASIKPSSYSDTQIEDTNSTDSSSVGDVNDKKQRRKLRLPFGKKSNKTKLA